MSDHYRVLTKHLPAFYGMVGLLPEEAEGDLRAHGDKCYCFRETWAKHGVPFAHGVAVYLLSYHPPFDSTVRETANGDWIAPETWVIVRYHSEFKDLLRTITGVS